MKPTKENKKAFARRFAGADWCYLCSKMDFLRLIEGGEFGAAEACAHKYLSDPRYVRAW